MPSRNEKEQAKNVRVGKGVNENMSSRRLLYWLNQALDTDFSDVMELSSGAAYCQLLHILFPRSISMKRIKFDAADEYHFLQNFKILQAAFTVLNIDRIIPVAKLMKGFGHYDFLVWYHKFFEANDKRIEYDAVAMRFYAEICKTNNKNPNNKNNLTHRNMHGSLKVLWTIYNKRRCSTSDSPRSTVSSGSSGGPSGRINYNANNNELQQNTLLCCEDERAMNEHEVTEPMPETSESKNWQLAVPHQRCLSLEQAILTRLIWHMSNVWASSRIGRDTTLDNAGSIWQQNVTEYKYNDYGDTIYNNFANRGRCVDQFGAFGICCRNSIRKFQTQPRTVEAIFELYEQIRECDAMLRTVNETLLGEIDGLTSLLIEFNRLCMNASDKKAKQKLIENTTNFLSNLPCVLGKLKRCCSN